MHKPKASVRPGRRPAKDPKAWPRFDGRTTGEVFMTLNAYLEIWAIGKTSVERWRASGVNDDYCCVSTGISVIRLSENVPNASMNLVSPLRSTNVTRSE